MILAQLGNPTFTGPGTNLTGAVNDMVTVLNWGVGAVIVLTVLGVAIGVLLKVRRALRTR